MQRVKTTPAGPGAPSKVPAPGQPSAVGPRPPALPRKQNTRDYGKAAPAPMAPPSPFGPPTGGAFG